MLLGFAASALSLLALQNDPPTLTTNLDENKIAIRVGVPFSFRLISRDPDGDKIRYSCLYDCNELDLNPETGIVTLYPKEPGLHDFQFGVSDGVNLNFLDVYVNYIGQPPGTPQPNNQPPHLRTNVGNSVTIQSGSPYKFSLFGYDKENAPLLYECLNNCQLVEVHPNTGEVSLKTQIAGTFDIKLAVTDGVNWTSLNMHADILP